MLLDPTQRAYLDALHAGDHGEAERLELILEAQTEAHRARLEAPGALASAALWYAAQGIRVFPAQPRGKQPVVGLKWADRATTDVHTIRGWWQTTPDANVAVVCGERFDVIDVDGPEPMRRMLTELLPSVTVIGHVLTSRQAGNHFYVPVTGEGCRVDVYPGIDYRGRGGYVIAPPSFGANGARYTWVQPLAVAA